MCRISLLCASLLCACGRSDFADREVSTCAPFCADETVVGPALIRADEEVIPTALVHAGDGDVVVTGWLRRPSPAIASRSLDLVGEQVGVDGGAGLVFIARLDASLNTTWRHVYGDAGTDSEVRSTTSIGTAVITCGIQEGNVRFQGQDAIADSGYQHPVLTEHDATGAVRDVHVLPAARGNAQCLDIAGNERTLAIAGLFSGDVTPGDAQLTALSDPNGYVGVYERATMTPRWSLGFFDTLPLTARGIAIAHDDALYVGGWFEGESNFGGAELFAAASTDAFLLRYAAGGSAAWTSVIGGAAVDRLADMTTIDDDVIVCLYAESALFDIGGLEVATSGSGEAVVARIAASGAGLWARVIAALAGSGCSAVVVDSAAERTLR